MRHVAFCMLLLVSLAWPTWAQPEFYSDAFLGLPEFRALPLLLPAPNADSTQIEVHVRIVYDDLQFIKKGDVYRAGYGLDVIVRDQDDRLLGSQHFERKVTATSYAQTNSRQQGDQTRALFTVSPQDCNLRINLIDRESRKTRSLEKVLEFPDKYWKQSLRLGDPVLVDSTGNAILTSGLLQGEPLRVVYRLYSSDGKNLSLFYRLFDANDSITSAGPITLKDEGPYYADTLDVPTDSLTNQSYRLVLVANQGENSINRSYPFKVLAQNLPDYVQDLDLAIQQLKYIATDEEYRQLTTAPASKREQLFREFWAKKDPSPSSPTNEKMDEYYRRVKYANEQFTGYRGGWQSDMGRVYIIFGAPTDIERHPFDINAKPYEIWYYYDINRKFVFMDEEGFGDYRLVSPFWDDY